jgi:hypothetical protein
MIKIFKNKIVYTNGKKKKKYDLDDLPMFFGDTVELDDKLTFLDFFEVLNANRDVVNFVFAQVLGFYKFEQFYFDLKKPIAKEEANDYKNEYLEVYHVPDLFRYEANEPFDYNPYVDLHMVKLKDEDGNENVQYGIALTSLSTLKKHKLKINKKVEFILQDSTKKVTKKSMEPAFIASHNNFKLFDLISGILYEISFHGSPEDKNSVAENLKNTIRDYEAQQKDANKKS